MGRPYEPDHAGADTVSHIRRLKSVLSDAIMTSGPSDNSKRYDKYLSITGAPCIPLSMNTSDVLCLSFEDGKIDIHLSPMHSLHHPKFSVYSKSDVLVLLDYSPFTLECSTIYQLMKKDIFLS